jgi:hypothetical protein
MEVMTDKIVEIWEMMDKYEDLKARNRTIGMVLTGEKIEASVKELKKHSDELYFRRQNLKDEITPVMIEQAKAFPFSELIEFKNKSAMCPFHEGQTPALRYYPESNTAWCFACCRMWDTIEWVKEKDGLSFKDAVKRLQ